MKNVRDECNRRFVWLLCLGLTGRDADRLAQLVKHLRGSASRNGLSPVGGIYLERGDDTFENSHAARAGTDTGVAERELCGFVLHILVHQKRWLEETLAEKRRGARGCEAICDETDPELERVSGVAESSRRDITWLALEVSSARRWIIGAR